MVARLLWSMVLLVPFFGVLIYVFSGSNPAAELDQDHRGSGFSGD